MTRIRSPAAENPASPQPAECFHSRIASAGWRVGKSHRIRGMGDGEGEWVEEGRIHVSQQDAADGAADERAGLGIVVVASVRLILLSLPPDETDDQAGPAIEVIVGGTPRVKFRANQKFENQAFSSRNDGGPDLEEAACFGWKQRAGGLYLLEAVGGGEDFLAERARFPCLPWICDP